MTETTLKIHIEGADARTFETRERIVKIGKLPSSHLRIDHDDVARMHAVLEQTPDGLFVVDLGSATGTFVGGKRVNKARVVSGDRLAFGRVEARIEIAEGSGVNAPSPAAPARAPLPSPFAAPVVEVAASTAELDEPGDPQFRWGIAASGPPVNPAEVETTASAAEVVLMWGEESVLHVAHLSPPRPFFVGEASADSAVDYAIDPELLGTTRLPLVVESAGQVVIVVPEGASGDVTVGADVRTIDALAEEGKLRPSSAIAGARELTLPAGAIARVSWRGFQVVTKSTSAGKAIGGDVRAPSWATHAWTAASLAFHAALLLIFYFQPPGSASLSLDLENDPSRLVDYLVEAPEAVVEETPTWVEENEDDGGTSGEAAAGDSGEMGDPESAPTTGAYAVEGPSDNPDPHLSRDAAVEAARTSGAIGALAMLAGTLNAPTSPFGRDTALGTDPMNALGALMGDNLGTNFGFGGLGPHGTGIGGGGEGWGTIGLGRFGGGLGHGCTGGRCGEGPGFGDGVPGGGHPPREHTPSIHVEDAHVVGSLSREVIRRTVRRHINEVRFCYEQELASRPDLGGRVAVQFMIGLNGAVTSAEVASSTVGNARVESCIAGAVRRWTFPAPEGGVVGVTYPFVLDSGE